MNEFIVTDHGVKADLPSLQTEALQKIFDLCPGTVVFPAGTYRTGGLLIRSDTTILLKSGAVLVGSDERTDYPVFPVPEGVELRTDMEMITGYYTQGPWKEYRRAILSAYGEKNIAILGEEGSLIDGSDCYDPDAVGIKTGFTTPAGHCLAARTASSSRTAKTSFCAAIRSAPAATSCIRSITAKIS